MSKIQCHRCKKMKELNELFDYDELVEVSLCKECCHYEEKTSEEKIYFYNLSLENYREILKQCNIKKIKKYIYAKIREIEEKINKIENKCDGCELQIITNKIVDGEGKKYHSYTCAERESRSMLCCLSCNKMIPVSRHVYELTKKGIFPGISCPGGECERKIVEKLKRETGKEFSGIIDVDENNGWHFR